MGTPATRRVASAAKGLTCAAIGQSTNAVDDGPDGAYCVNDGGYVRANGLAACERASPKDPKRRSKTEVGGGAPCNGEWCGSGFDYQVDLVINNPPTCRKWVPVGAPCGAPAWCARIVSPVVTRGCAAPRAWQTHSVTSMRTVSPASLAPPPATLRGSPARVHVGWSSPRGGAAPARATGVPQALGASTRMGCPCASTWSAKAVSTLQCDVGALQLAGIDCKDGACVSL